jgi:hypothetical protein
VQLLRWFPGGECCRIDPVQRWIEPASDGEIGWRMTAGQRALVETSGEPMCTHAIETKPGGDVIDGQSGERAEGA